MTLIIFIARALTFSHRSIDYFNKCCVFHAEPPWCKRRRTLIARGIYDFSLLFLYQRKTAKRNWNCKRNRWMDCFDRLPKKLSNICASHKTRELLSGETSFSSLYYRRQSRKRFVRSQRRIDRAPSSPPEHLIREASSWRLLLNNRRSSRFNWIRTGREAN